MAAPNPYGKYGKLIVYLAVVVLINLAGITLFFRVDLTENGIYSISKASRRVAMKFLHAEGAGCGEITTRFKREGQRFADLKHPSIVEVFGLGKEHGLLYIACEFVEGRNLTEIDLLPWRCGGTRFGSQLYQLGDEQR